MAATLRRGSVGGLLLVWATGVAAQPLPPLHQPVRAETRAEQDRLEAQRLYGLSLIHEKRHEPIRALKALEEARRLDPGASAVHRALVPLYLALDRVDDALASCRAVLELEPDDFETGYLYARRLRGEGRAEDAALLLQKLLADGAVRERPEVEAQLAQELATLEEERSRWLEAAAAYRRAADILDHPDRLEEGGPVNRDELRVQTADVYEKAGQMYLRGGRAAEAITSWEKARRNDPGRVGKLALLLAGAHERQGDLRKAALRIEEHLRAEPGSVQGYALKAGLLRQTGQAALVLLLLEQAARGQPDSEGLQLLLAAEYRKGGPEGRRKALAVYGRLGKEHPSPEVFRELLETYQEAGATPGAVALELLDGAVQEAEGEDKRPGSPLAAARARGLLVALRDRPAVVRKMIEAAGGRLERGEEVGYRTRFHLAGLAARVQALDAAEQMYRGCLREGLSGGKVEHDVYQGLLHVLMRGHKNREIVELCRQGLERAQATNRVLFHLEMSRALAALGRDREALKAADDAVGESGEGTRLLSRRSRAYLLAQVGQVEQAVGECHQLLREYNQAEDVRDIRYTLSGVYSTARDLARAEEQLRVILAASPEDATACNDLGYLLADQGKGLEEAERLVRKALRLDRRQRGTGTSVGLDSDQDSAAFVDSLGWVLFRRGRLQEAREQLERAASLPEGKEDPVVWDHLGDVYFRLGQAERARSAWRKSLELFDTGRRRAEQGRYRAIQEKLTVSRMRENG